MAFTTALLAGCGPDRLEKGAASLRLGDYDGARAFFEEELKSNPESFEARLGIGKALLQKAVAYNSDTATWRKALVQLEAARTLSPGAEIEPLLGEVWLAHARNLLSRHDTVRALSAISRAVECTPDRVEPLNLAGIIYYRQGYEEKAEALFRKAVTVDSVGASAHFNLGMVYWRREMTEKAHSHWLTALKRDPDDEDIVYWFARAEKAIREEDGL